MFEPTLIYNAIKTPDGTIIESTYRHDYRTHQDANGKEYMIDGGLAYSRRSANGDEVCLCKYSDEPHEVQRELVTWGTYGKNGDELFSRKKVSDMTTDHIKAVLNECDPSGVHRDCMEKELEHRSEI